MKKEKIEDVLLKMGIPPHIKGFGYITQAILMLDEDEWRNHKITLLYHAIGQTKKTTGSRVERAIRHAFEIARDVRSDYEAVDHYIGFINTTNGASLSRLHLMLKREEENEESNA